MSSGVRLAVFYVAVFAAPGAAMPFLPSFLASRGLDETAIGLVLAVQQMVRLGAGPLGGRLADALAARGRAVALYAFLSAAGVAMFLPAWGLPGLLLAAALYGALAAPIVPLADSIAFREASAGRMDFGLVRSLGSVSFMLFTGIGAVLLQNLGPEAIVLLMVFGQAATGLSALFLPSGRLPPARAGFRSAGAMLSGPFLLLLLSAGLVQGSHALVYAFSTLHWTAAGHSTTTVGLLWAVSVVAEIVLLARARALTGRFGPVQLASLAALAATLRWLGLAVTTELWALVLLQILHAASFACMMLASLALVARLAPPELAGTAQAVHAAFGPGLGLFVLTLASGPLYAAVGGLGFLVMAVASAAAFPALVLLARRLPSSAGPA